jgi:PEGA domain-containing protein
MSTARDLIIDQLAPVVESGARLTTWYAQGHSDGLGDRLLMFDNTSAPSWEILRFKPALVRDPRFETALRHRVERLSTFHHPAFPLVRSIKELGYDSGLAVVSTHVSGVRLSDAIKKPRSAEFAFQLIRQLMPALHALHEHGPALAHGALTLDRVVLTAEGRLTIREHMMGSALGGLELSAARLWSEFAILVPPTSAAIARLDGRSDVAQLALVALSLIAGRRIGPDEYPHAVPELLERLVRPEVLRQWLHRALQIDDGAFGSVREATDALSEPQPQPPPPREEDRFDAPLRFAPSPASRSEPPRASAPRPVERPHPLAPTGIVPMAPATRPAMRAMRWAAIAATLVALAEGAFIGRMLFDDTGPLAPPTAAAGSVAVSAPPITIAANDQPAPVPPLSVQVEQQMPGLRVLSAVAADPALAAADPRAIASKVDAAPLPPPDLARNGGFRVSAPIELHVLDGERVLGSSFDGPIMARAGRYELEFVNSVIGYRARREVDVRAGQITTLSIPVPNGRLNINATPWASVWIDGTAYGETPLGNLSIPSGEHEIVFRHPQLGERREKVIVRPDTPGRVAVSLQR